MIMEQFETTLVYHHNCMNSLNNRVNIKIGNFNSLVDLILPLHKSLLEHQQYSSPEPDV